MWISGRRFLKFKKNLSLACAYARVVVAIYKNNVSYFLYFLLDIYVSIYLFFYIKESEEIAFSSEVFGRNGNKFGRNKNNFGSYSNKFGRNGLFFGSYFGLFFDKNRDF